LNADDLESEIFIVKDDKVPILKNIRMSFVIKKITIE
jgi:hypothetical protein